MTRRNQHLPPLVYRRVRASAARLRPPRPWCSGLAWCSSAKRDLRARGGVVAELNAIEVGASRWVERGLHKGGCGTVRLDAEWPVAVCTASLLNSRFHLANIRPRSA